MRDVIRIARGELTEGACMIATMRGLLIVLLVASCGRIDFDPVLGGSGAGGSDDPRLISLAVATGGQNVAYAIPASFDENITSYEVDVGLAVESVELEAVPLSFSTLVTIAGASAPPDVYSDPIPLALGSTTITIIGTAANGATATYTVTVVRAAMIAQGSYLKASNTDATDLFGITVAIAGDTLAIGAYNEASAATGIDGDQTDNSLPSAGAVYVFVRSGASWMQQAYLKAASAQAGAFGSSLALDGDTLVVGEPFDASSATGVDGDSADASLHAPGAAYVFARSGTTWTQQAYLKASNTDAGDVFGMSLALSADTLVVGAYGESSAASGVDGDQTDNSKNAAGAAYVFVRAGTTWSQQAYLKASNPDAADFFGAAVAIVDDLVVIGARGEASAAAGVDGDETDNSVAGAGAAYVFSRSGATWTQDAYLKASNPDAFDRFGTALSLSGTTLAVGAPFEASAATGVDGDQLDNSLAVSGAVYVFTRTGGTWAQQVYLKAAAAGQDSFGAGVSLSGDTLAIGAPNEASAATGIDGDEADTSASQAGAAYLFTRTGVTWAQAAYLKASNANAVDLFGGALALSGDTLVVGAQGESSDATGVDGNQADNSASSAGAAYVFE